jgi:hypothetical protein
MTGIVTAINMATGRCPAGALNPPESTAPNTVTNQPRQITKTTLPTTGELPCSLIHSKTREFMTLPPSDLLYASYWEGVTFNLQVFMDAL